MKYYLLPDFSKFSIKTVCAAMGQLFFSMSLAMGIMISYGSYVKDEVNIMKSVNHIEIFDTAIALLSGLMIVPAVCIFSGEEGLKSSGVGLMFSTLPRVFADMPFGNVIVGTKAIEDEVIKNGENFGRKKVFRVMIKYVAPVCLVVILIFYSLAQFGFISY